MQIALPHPQVMVCIESVRIKLFFWEKQWLIHVRLMQCIRQCNLTEEKKALKGKRQNRYSLVSLQMFCSGGRRKELAVLARLVGTCAPGQKIFPLLYFPVKKETVPKER